MIVTVVIPTHNRGTKLIPTVERLLANDAGRFDEVEVIVVDDGSTPPAGPLVGDLCVPTPYTLRCVRLEPNVGPAGARNAGFRSARGDIVIFVDDDVLAPPDFIRKHVDAHRARPGSVICGRWRVVEPEPMTAMYRYVSTLGFDAAEGSAEEFFPIKAVSSTHISVERSMFPSDQGVYRDGLSVPAAEEHELALRLRERGVPIYLATRIVANHDYPVTLAFMCRQAFKHSLGCAEVVAKCPGTRILPEVRNIIDANWPASKNDSAALVGKKAMKRLMSARPARSAMLWAAEWAEHLLPVAVLLAPIYRTVLGLHVFAGVREGIRIYHK